jgi:hypothetical protein
MLKKILLTASALAFGVSMALAQTLPLPGIPGPSLGDFNTNLYTLTKGVEAGSTVAVGVALSVSQTSGQANCTQFGQVHMVHNIATSAGTGYVCLPPAIPGFFKVIQNNTTSAISIYGGGPGNQYVPGTQDTINGTTGSTAFTGLGSRQQAICIVGNGGAWNCSVGTNGTANPGTFTTLSATGVATFSGQIVVTGQGLPTIASGACGTTTNGAVVAGSTNQSGSITIGSAATTTCTISWSATLASAPKACTFFPMNATAAATGTTVAYNDAPTTTAVVLHGSALASSNYGYVCL